MDVNHNLNSDKNIRVLFVNSFFNGGGAESVMRHLYQGLPEKYNIKTWCVVGRENDIPDNVEVIYKSVVRKALNWIVRKNSEFLILHDSFSLKKILKLIEKYKIDIVHFHNIHGNYFGIRDMIKVTEKCKVIWTLHDMWAITGHCAQPIDCQKWKNSNEIPCEKCNYLELYPPLTKQITAKLVQEKNDVFTNRNIEFVTPSVWLKNKIVDSFLGSENVNVIGNGVNIDIFIKRNKIEERKNRKIDTQKTIFLFSANGINSPYKGLDILIKALNMCKYHDGILLVAVGDGKLEGLSDKLEVHYVGRIESEREMNKVYALADVFIIPSRAENYPCSVLESMASGTPVIGSDVGGITEQISDDVGWVFPDGDSKKLSIIIDKIVAGEYNLREYGRRCRKKAQNVFNQDIMIQCYYELYNRMLEREGNGLR